MDSSQSDASRASGTNKTIQISNFHAQNAYLGSDVEILGAKPSLISADEQSRRIWQVPYQLTTSFIERHSVLADIINRFKPSAEPVQPVNILCLRGMGGVGKTQLALRYAHHDDNEYAAIIWLDASSFITLLNNMYNAWKRITDSRDVGRDENIPLENLAERLLKLLDRIQKRWLLILDNADDVDLRKVRGLFTAKAKGDILITTRQKDSERISNIPAIFVSGMEKTEAKNLFIANANIKNPTDADLKSIDDIIDVCGSLPLAIELAGAFIMGNDFYASSNLDQYVQFLRRQKQYVLQITPEEYVKDYSLSVITVWESCYERIKARSEMAAAIVTLFSLFDRTTLSYHIFFLFYASALHWPTEDPVDPTIVYEKLSKSIFELSSEEYGEPKFHHEVWRHILAFHLIEANPEQSRQVDAPIHMMHPLVHEWAFIRLSKADKSEWLKTALLILVVASKAAVRSMSRMINIHLSHLVSFIPWLIQDRITVEACAHLQDFAIQQRNWSAVEALAPYVIAFEGETPEQKLDALELRVTTLAAAHKVEEAIETAEKCVEGWRSIKPQRPDRIAGALCLLGKYLVYSNDKSRCRRAIILLEESKAQQLTQLDGDVSPEALHCQEYIAVARSVLGEHDAAISLLDQVITDGSAIPRGPKFDILMTKKYLGDCLYFKVKDERAMRNFSFQQGIATLERAKSVLEELIKERTEILGTNHADTELTYRSLRQVNELRMEVFQQLIYFSPRLPR